MYLKKADSQGNSILKSLQQRPITKGTKQEKTGGSSATLVSRNKDFFPQATVFWELHYFGCMSQYLNQLLEGRN